MASGRTVRATLAGADRRRCRGLPGVEDVEVRGDTVIVRGKDSDAVARYLLNQTAARDLEITTHNLEDAFLALTARRVRRRRPPRTERPMTAATPRCPPSDAERARPAAGRVQPDVPRAWRCGGCCATAAR